MLIAHEEGHSVVGSYPREIAEMKALQGNDFAAKQGYVLLFTPEKQ
jgi:ATP-dependent Clp protease adapter protein ClpS